MKNTIKYVVLCLAAITILWACQDDTLNDKRSQDDANFQMMIDNGFFENRKVIAFPKGADVKTFARSPEANIVKYHSDLPFEEILRKVETKIKSNLESENPNAVIVQQNIYQLLDAHGEALNFPDIQKRTAKLLEALLHTNAVEWKRMAQLFVMTKATRTDSENKVLAVDIQERINQKLTQQKERLEIFAEGNDGSPAHEFAYKSIEQNIAHCEESLALLR